MVLCPFPFQLSCDSLPESGVKNTMRQNWLIRYFQMKIIFTFCLYVCLLSSLPINHYIYTTLIVNDRSLSPVSYFHLIAWRIGFNRDSILFQIQLRPYSIANDIRVNALLSSQDRCLKKAILSATPFLF